jgi:octaprenyl-diphosphate synthase
MNAQTFEFNEIVRPIDKMMNAFNDAFQSEFEFILSLDSAIENYSYYSRGKHLRPLLFFLCQGLIGQPKLTSVSTAVLLELVHLASLIHDDVIDSSPFRRGRKTLNAQSGNHFSVLIGDYLIARTLLLGQNQKNGVMPGISKTIMEMTRAELEQAAYEKKRMPEEDVYFSIIRGKTGSLFQTSAELGGHAVSVSPEGLAQMSQLGEQFGMVFQIQDDILDFIGKSEELGKPVYQDIQGGFCTLPLIEAYKDLQKNEKIEIEKILKSQPISKSTLLDFVHRHQGIEKAQSIMAMRSQRALEHLTFFPESDYRIALELLFKYNMNRTS